MEREKQVCSFEQSIKLKELGVSQQSLFYWSQSLTGHPAVLQNSNDNYDGWVPTVVSAFTVAELGLMLGYQSLRIHPLNHNLNEATDRADDLIHLLTIGELMVESVNERLAS